MKNIDNLKIFPIETDTIVDWSPAREVFKILGEEIEASIWNHIHLSRILRLSWLWKFGGLYLDTDVLVLSDLISKFSNESFVSLQSLHPQRGFSNSVVQLSRHHPLIIEWLGAMMEEYDSSNKQSWDDQTLSSVMLEYCSEQLLAGGGREVGRE